MSLDVANDYLCIGGNRQSAASTYCADIQCLAYGADQNIALWRPLSDARNGVHQLLQGHNDKVTAVAFASRGSITAENALVSGAADGTIILWSLSQSGHLKTLITNTKGHEGAVNVIATSAATSIFVTGGADTIINFWRLQDDQVSKVATVKPNPRFIPLALAIGAFSNSAPDQGFFLAAAGTRNDIHVYSVTSDASVADLACCLTGHEGWIRSLALRKSDHGYLLASTSADKYTRLWKFQPDISESKQNGHIDKDIPGFQQTLTGKVKSVGFGVHKLFITFDALLLGHEDWVYSADWQTGEEQKLLTASADGTLAIWEPDPTSGIWVSEARLGEISGQKGATTATGSSGGFWTGKWIGDSTVISLGRTGSWRMWQYNAGHVFWDLKPGIGGHIDSVNGLCWSPAGEYLLTTSSDQTTRLHAEWRREEKRSWHEFSRCQIHGYNCNVVACINSHQFVSGADEKLLRVFNEPKEMAETLHRLCRIEPPKDQSSLPETAAIPVLGLSNKEMGEPDDIIEAGPRKGDEDYAAANALAGVSIKGITEPPTEDLLSRHTLWPECEKLYGHGYEISEAAYSSGMLATACKASSIDHAMIRVYDPDKSWRQIEPPLAAHSLTVTRLAWSTGSVPSLLSVGRDRQWSLFKVGAESKALKLFQSMPKAHARMILDAAFSPSGAHNYFLTAGRDKTVKIWGTRFQYAEGSDSHEYALFQTIARPTAVTAIAVLTDPSELNAVLAVGEEDGTLSIHIFDTKDLRIERSIEVDKQFCLNKAINRLAWRPHGRIIKDASIPGMQLAVAGADGSVRILTLNVLAVCRELAHSQ